MVQKNRTVCVGSGGAVLKIFHAAWCWIIQGRRSALQECFRSRHERQPDARVQLVTISGMGTRQNSSEKSERSQTRPSKNILLTYYKATNNNKKNAGRDRIC